MILAHLLGDQWHVADLLLYVGVGLGLLGGIGLMLWGRRERHAFPAPESPPAVPAGRASLIRRSEPPRRTLARKAPS